MKRILLSLLLAVYAACATAQVPIYTRPQSGGTVTNTTIASAWGGEDSITAFAGGGQASATALSATVNSHRITTVATAGDSVKLPAATVGATHYVRNDGANNLQVFGTSPDTINGVATATGVTQAPGMGVFYMSTTAAQWTAIVLDRAIVTKNGAHAIGVQVSGQGFVGIGRNSTTGGMSLFGGTTTPSDTNPEGLLVSGSPPSLVLSSTLKICWSSSNVTQTCDTGVTRNAAGALEINSGTTGTFRDLILRKITNYNSTTTAGLGVPGIVAAGRSTAQAAAVGTVATFTVGAADGSFEVSANVLVTTATTHNFTATVAYTDEGNTARTTTFAFIKSGDVTAVSTPTIVNTNGAIAYQGIPLHIRCKSATAITIATTGTFTTVVYNVEGTVKQTS